MHVLNEYRQLAGFALLLVILFWPQVSSLLTKLKSAWTRFKLPNWNTATATKEAVNEDEEIRALKLLDKRFQRLKNVEGIKAMQVIKHEFFMDNSVTEVTNGTN